MRAVKSLGVVALLATMVVGCSTGLSVIGGRTDDVPAVDVSIDAAIDLGAPDVSTMDAFDAPSMDSPDVSAMDAPDAPTPDTPDVPFRCAANADCAGNAGGPVCDTTTGACVACTAASDVCPTGRYCDDASRTCVAGCRDDGACSGAPSDGGTPADGSTGRGRRCDRVSRTCVECLENPDCPAGTLCVGSICVTGCTAGSPCPSGQTCCSGACVDNLANIAHCGGCDMRCAVPNGTPNCLNGNCTVGTCAAPFGNCDGNNANGCETNTLVSVEHCGGCGVLCATPANATPTCTAGTCGFACVAGFADCDMNPANGCEVNLNTDLTHCGSCVTVCNPPNGTAACASGVCAIASCASGFGDCDGNATNGCETDVRRSVGNCGGCGRACPDRANAFPGCLAGACVNSCITGHQDCNGVEADGCEADLRVDGANCGSCGRSCSPSNATGMCATGRCAIVRCDDGFADCDGNADNGCEINLRSNASHCGACNNVCTATGGMAACVAGVCGLTTCSPGLADCDRAGNSCETNTTNDPRNCSGCGTVCDVPNATAGCSGSACTIAGCNAGFGNCSGGAADGCETNLNTTVTSCGACGTVCSLPNATPACRDGRCAVSRCNDGFADCDGNPANGCEVNTQVTVGACGACGNACSTPNGTPGCAGGACTVAGCNGGFANCNGAVGDGCEVNVTNDPRNCGVCGRGCSLPNTAVAGCGAGACTVLSCAGGYADCNGGASDGCEVNVSNDANNCGACGTRCASGVCREGACQSFGGGYEVSGSPCNNCHNANAFTGSCGCPGGFPSTVSWGVINDCQRAGSQINATATFCGAPAPASSEYGGAYQQDDGVGGGLGCRATNPYTGGCSCPGGYTAIGFRTLVRGTSGGIIGSNPAICVSSGGARPSFGGAFQQDDAVPGGVGCRSGNPLTGGCSCPAGYGGSALRVEVDSSAGFIGSVVILCVR